MFEESDFLRLRLERSELRARLSFRRLDLGDLIGGIDRLHNGLFVPSNSKLTEKPGRGIESVAYKRRGIVATKLNNPFTFRYLSARSEFELKTMACAFGSVFCLIGDSRDLIG